MESQGLAEEQEVRHTTGGAPDLRTCGGRGGPSPLPQLPPPSHRIRILESDLRFARSRSAGARVFEEEQVLRYESNPFTWRVRAQVEPLDAPGAWLVGFVQGCVAMHCENAYGASGSTWWEFHELSHGARRILNDSDGTSPPFYAVTEGRQLVALAGPLQPETRDEDEAEADERQPPHRRGRERSAALENADAAQRGRPFSLEMLDCFSPAISWQHPIAYASGPEAARAPPPLTGVRRAQRFLVWLALFDRVRHTWFGLQAIRWSYTLELRVDVRRPLGDRVRVVRDEPRCEPLRPADAERLVRLPPDVLLPPYANACQSLVWRPRHREDSAQKAARGGHLRVRPAAGARRAADAAALDVAALGARDAARAAARTARVRRQRRRRRLPVRRGAVTQ